ncbi:hypothetical protein [Nostoc sp.]
MIDLYTRHFRNYKTTRSLLWIPINDTVITEPTAIAGVKLMRG